jgi:ribosomal protein S18 acetylase RimI-like enzyme
VRYRFSNDFPLSRIDEVINFTLGPRLWTSDAGYPDLALWGQRLHRELGQSRKRALVAFEHDKIIGSIIYREHETKPGTLEIRRITIHPSHEGRYVSDFLLRNVELSSQEDFQARNVIVDSKTNAFGMIHFLIRNGYRITGLKDLYGLGGGDDFMFQKYLRHDSGI